MSAIPDSVELTRVLVAMDTVNPPGNEECVARVLAELLQSAGFDVLLDEFAPGRSNVMARKGGGEGTLLFSGHMDTVPFGSAPWSFDPLSGEIVDGRMFGRGTSDMKSGLAAMVCAAMRAASAFGPNGPSLQLALTAAEETGCKGVAALRDRGLLCPVRAVLIAEPTSNRPRLGHKGVLWLKAGTKGRTAHASSPELGDNALLKALDLAERLRSFPFDGQSHPVLGEPSLALTTFQAGASLNCIPDRAEIGLDIRTIPGLVHVELLGRLRQTLGPELEALEVLDDQQGIWTEPDDPWALRVFEVVEGVTGKPCRVEGIRYFTDGSTLWEACGQPATVILGPGEEGQAHMTDEFCPVENIRQAEEIFTRLALGWANGN
ncbi:MAG: M20 family peptidase [Deltaproteobacteria bacterium]|nr:M20 family peptidase [Deltaproteobacteria bacterium]